MLLLDDPLRALRGWYLIRLRLDKTKASQAFIAFAFEEPLTRNAVERFAKINQWGRCACAKCLVKGSKLGQCLHQKRCLSDGSRYTGASTQALALPSGENQTDEAPANAVNPSITTIRWGSIRRILSTLARASPKDWGEKSWPRQRQKQWFSKFLTWD